MVSSKTEDKTTSFLRNENLSKARINTRWIRGQRGATLDASVGFIGKEICISDNADKHARYKLDSSLATAVNQMAPPIRQEECNNTAHGNSLSPNQKIPRSSEYLCSRPPKFRPRS